MIDTIVAWTIVICVVCFIISAAYIYVLREAMTTALNKIDRLERVLKEVEQRTCVYTGSGYGTSGGGESLLGVTMSNESYVTLRTIITVILTHLGLVVEHVPATQKSIKLKGRNISKGTVEKI